MRRIPGLRRFGVLIGVLLALGCMPVPPHPQIDSLEPDFSDRLARAHLEALEGLFPRLPGSRGDKIARAYLTREFRVAGAKTRVLVDGDRRHLIAEKPGDSDDVVLLVAPYPALRTGAWIDDSGAALLLEFARVVGSARLPYTLGFALAEIRPAEVTPAVDPAGADPNWRPVLTPVAARWRLSEAGHSLARGIESVKGGSRIRAVIVFDTSADAGLQVARDLRSHPEFRRLFWESAATLGFDSVFPPDGDWTSPESLHLGFREREMDRTLALVHLEVGNANSLATRAPGEDFPVMFDAIGSVTVDALSKLMRRFEKVDAFSR